MGFVGQPSLLQQLVDADSATIAGVVAMRATHRALENCLAAMSVTQRLQPLLNPLWPRVPGIAETAARDWQQPGNGGIVCHCELVTRREVEQALQGPLAAGSLAELKRRTRVTMGRCQGFYCSAELSELTDGQFAQALGEEF